MPTYAYRCKNCKHQFETIQKMTDDPLKECPECKGPIARILFPVGIMFKGSGFHINDYPSSSSAATPGERLRRRKPRRNPQPRQRASSRRSGVSGVQSLYELTFRD